MKEIVLVFINKFFNILHSDIIKSFELFTKNISISKDGKYALLYRNQMTLQRPPPPLPPLPPLPLPLPPVLPPTALNNDCIILNNVYMNIIIKYLKKKFSDKITSIVIYLNLKLSNLINNTDIYSALIKNDKLYEFHICLFKLIAKCYLSEGVSEGVSEGENKSENESENSSALLLILRLPRIFRLLFM